jgi:hypothetical protein
MAGTGSSLAENSKRLNASARGRAANLRVVGCIDVGELVYERIALQQEVLEDQAAIEAQLRLALGIGGVAVEIGGTDVRVTRREGDIERVGRRAHGEQEPAARHVRLDLIHGRVLMLPDFVISGGARFGFVTPLPLHVPGGASKLCVELPVLAREILVV